MPRNGNGNFILPPGNPVISGTDISSSVHNATMSDIASEISNSLAKDGQTVPTGNLPMGGFKHTGVSGGSSRNEYPSIGQIQDNSATWAGTASGTANAVLLTVSPAIPSYVAGQAFAYKALSTNTGALVISIGGLPNRNVQINGYALVAGDHVAGQWYRVTYDGAAFQLEQISSRPLLRDPVSVRDFGAVGDGVVDDTTAIQLACAASDYVFFPHGEYLIGVNTTIPFGVVLKFAFGAQIKVGTNVTLTFNGGIEANPYQHIFSGHLIQSGFTSGVVPPYVFGVQGSPQIDYATPFWFGAKGDDVSDDGPSIDCSLYFGFTTYIPSANYYTSRGFNIKRSNVRIYGDGRSSRIRTDNPSSPAVMQFNGNVVPVANCICENIAFDAGDLSGVNGFGFGFSSNCVLRNAWFYNCGHYAFTMQFDVFDNIAENIFIDESATVAGSTRASFSFEGAQTDGSDCRGNSVRNIYTKKAHNKLVKMTKSSMCCVSGVWAEEVGLGGAEPAAIHLSACWDCIVENVFVDTITGLGINVVGQSNCRRNTLRGIKFGMISGNISILIDGRENIIDGVTLKTDYGAASAVRVRDENNYLKNIFITDAPSARVILCDIAGTGSVFDGCRVTGSSGVGFYTSQPNVKVINNYFSTDGIAIDIEGAGCLVKGNTIEGNTAGRINIRSAGAGSVVVDNYLTGGSAATVSGIFAGYASSVVCNNSGDNGTAGTVRIGSYSLWVDSAGKLRLKLGDRSSNTDGVIVGTQS